MHYNKRGKFVPYITIGSEEEVIHSILKDEHSNTYNRPIIVRIEKPDKIYGFKEVQVNLDDMIIEERIGYTDEELKKLIDFLFKNKVRIEEYAMCGGVWNWQQY